MSPERNTPPTLSPKLLTEERDMLVRAVEKWLKFQHNMWSQINDKLEKEISRYGRWGMWFRLLIIILSASVTVISEIGAVPRTAVTVTAGVLTALTGVEAFLKFNERQSESRKQQREIEALRDKLRFEWMVKVEIEGDSKKRIAEAKRLLVAGPEAYNEVLDKYILKAEKGDAPQANVGG